MIVEKMGMAWTGTVVTTTAIKGADRIRAAVVNCGTGGEWAGVVSLDVEVGSPVVVFLPDAVVPNIECLSFMEKRHFRVSMCRLKGAPSEVLIMPKNLFNEYGIEDHPAGADVTVRLGVKKHEKEILASLSFMTLGPRPDFIPKTDEPNFQSVPELVAALVGQPYIITEKCDGRSLTFYWYKGHFGCCSRNLELKDTENNEAWHIARKYGLTDRAGCSGWSCAIQGEFVGPGIQGNPLGLHETDIRVFDVYDIDGREYLGYESARAIITTLGLPSVAECHIGESFYAMTATQLRELAQGFYSTNKKLREGIVIRSKMPMRVAGQRVSFKVINLDYFV